MENSNSTPFAHTSDGNANVSIQTKRCYAGVSLTSTANTSCIMHRAKSHRAPFPKRIGKSRVILRCPVSTSAPHEYHMTLVTPGLSSTTGGVVSCMYYRCAYNMISVVRCAKGQCYILTTFAFIPLVSFFISVLKTSLSWRIGQNSTKKRDLKHKSRILILVDEQSSR